MIVLAGCELYLLLVFICVGRLFFWVLLRESPCESVHRNIILPFITATPTSAAFAVIGPFGYIMHNTFGGNPRLNEPDKKPEVENANPVFESEKGGSKE
jgi:hypothetical protein